MLYNSVVLLFSRNMLYRALRCDSPCLYFKLFKNYDNEKIRTLRSVIFFKLKKMFKNL